MRIDKGILAPLPPEYWRKSYRNTFYPIDDDIYEENVTKFVEEAVCPEVNLGLNEDELMFLKNFFYASIYYCDKRVMKSEQVWNIFRKLAKVADREGCSISVFEIMCEDYVEETHGIAKYRAYYPYYEKMKNSYQHFPIGFSLQVEWSVKAYVNKRRKSSKVPLYTPTQMFVPDPDLIEDETELPELIKKERTDTYQEAMRKFYLSLLPEENRNERIGPQLADFFLKNNLTFGLKEKNNDDKHKTWKALENRINRVILGEKGVLSKFKLEELEEIVNFFGTTPNEILYDTNTLPDFHEWNDEDIVRFANILKDSFDPNDYSIKIRTDSITGVSLFLNYNGASASSKNEKVTFQVLYINPVDYKDKKNNMTSKDVYDSLHFRKYKDALLHYRIQVLSVRNIMYQYWDKNKIILAKNETEYFTKLPNSYFLNRKR